jgi:DNA-binding XRE family transcriptional regulator
LDNKKFSLIRSITGKTQEDLAQFLCVSPKVVRSYEQGRKRIPSTIERLTMLCLAMSYPRNYGNPPCYKVKDCPREWKEKCTAWQQDATYFCWFINGTYCQGRDQGSWENKIKICRECEVFIEMFRPHGMRP